MRLKSIELHNIRSYINQKIDFKDGITVLSGDIGAGKSSILLAAEFALFGLVSNDSGNGLLRKGTNEGSVSLTMDINNKEITVQRFLKRKSEGIRQTNGCLIVDNIKKDLMPVELKSELFRILGYSPSGKNSLYRYTTYTPQEEMKSILYENNEERLRTIRTIFGIDKYQNIIENAEIIAKQMRENKREIIGMISDLEQKKNDIKEIEKGKELLSVKEKDISIKISEIKKELEIKRNRLESIEKEMRKIELKKQEKSLLSMNYTQKQEQEKQTMNEIMKLGKEIQDLKSTIAPEKLEALKQRMKSGIQEVINNYEKELYELQKHVGEMEAAKRHSDQIKNQVKELDDCPLCFQKVSHTHKEAIIEKEDKATRDIIEKYAVIQEEIEALRKNIEIKKNELNDAKNAEREIMVMNIHIKSHSEKETTMKDKKETQEKIQNEIRLLDEKIKSIEIPQMNENEFIDAKKQCDDLIKNERTSEILYTQTITELKNLEREIIKYQKEINEKEKQKIRLEKIQNMENWIQDKFSGIMMTIEQQVLHSMHNTFNDIFMELFSVLIDDERLLARIDDTFTPLIEQNGHETEYANLSGGEKASVAVAYRLALYAAINTMVSNINTRGLLVLDEPTDGFSGEQLDKLKDVFEKIRAEQAIIVSHESKIESIADHVVRIGKSGHESVIF